MGSGPRAGREWGALSPTPFIRGSAAGKTWSQRGSHWAVSPPGSCVGSVHGDGAHVRVPECGRDVGTPARPKRTETQCFPKTLCFWWPMAEANFMSPRYFKHSAGHPQTPQHCS